MPADALKLAAAEMDQLAAALAAAVIARLLTGVRFPSPVEKARPLRAVGDGLFHRAVLRHPLQAPVDGRSGNGDPLLRKTAQHVRRGKMLPPVLL